MEHAIELTSDMANTGFDINIIFMSIINLITLVMNISIKILIIYALYLAIKALKKYLN